MRMLRLVQVVRPREDRPTGEAMVHPAAGSVLQAISPTFSAPRLWPVGERYHTTP